MSVMSRLRKLKLKKLQPGKLVKGVVDVAATVGVPGAGAAKKVVDRVGQKVEDYNRAAARVSAQLKKVAKESGLPTKLPKDGPSGDVSNVPVPSTDLPTTTAASGSNGMVLGLVAVVAVLFFMKGR